MSKRGGRNRKPGARYASGKLKPTGEPVAPAQWDRIRKDVIKAANDPRLGSEVGKLSFHKELTSAQTVAAFRVAEIYGAFERLEGIRRSACSASYESGLRGESGLSDDLLGEKELKAKITREADVRKAFLTVGNEISIYPRQLRDVLERLCVEDRAVDPGSLDGIRMMLDRLAGVFGVTSSAKRAPLAHRRAKTLGRPVKQAPRVDLDRQAFITVCRKLRPDLSEDELAQAHDFQRAIKARAVVRRQKDARQ